MVHFACLAHLCQLVKVTVAFMNVLLLGVGIDWSLALGWVGLSSFPPTTEVTQ
jgi:hypothetical protein